MEHVEKKSNSAKKSKKNKNSSEKVPISEEEISQLVTQKLNEFKSQQLGTGLETENYRHFLKMFRKLDKKLVKIKENAEISLEDKLKIFNEIISEILLNNTQLEEKTFIIKKLENSLKSERDIRKK